MAYATWRVKIILCILLECLNGVQYELLEAPPPVCMKYTASDGSRAGYYICHKTLIKSCILSYKQSGSVL